MSEKVTITALDVAKFFLSTAQAGDAGDTISNLKMQKLVYYAQGYHLALAGKRLFDENIEAWRHGPVVPSLYTALSAFGSKSIELSELGEVNLGVFTEDQTDMLDEVYDRYGVYSAFKLRDMTHWEKPWNLTTNNGEHVGRGNVIDDSLMLDYFTEYLDKKYARLLEEAKGVENGTIRSYSLEEIETLANGY